MLERFASGERRFVRANLQGANLERVNLEGAILENADLSGANLRGARIPGANLVAANLRGADLEEAYLYKTDFQSAGMQRTCLKGALLAETNLKWADLQDADLERASLYAANLMGANLRRANFKKTNLILANLMAAPTESTLFEDATLGSTQLVALNLSAFCNIRLHHREPSIIDYISLVESLHCPNLREFLRNAGMPQVFIDYMIECARSLSPDQRFSLMLSTFVSFGGPDEPFARQLNQALLDNGVPTFFYPFDAKLGEWNANVMHRGIREHDRVVVVCSRAPLSRAGVRTELNEARRKEATIGGESCLIPITIDDYVFGDHFKATDPELAEFLLERVVGDFVGADTNRAYFEQAFPRLLDALRRKVEITVRTDASR